jgi:hypothetical protein
MKSVQHVIDYLMRTIDIGINVDCKDLQLFIMADASYGIHTGGKGHSGYMISMGRELSYLHARSAKQKTISHSSTDAEIVAFYDCLKLSFWMRNVLTELGITPLRQIRAFQDNKSAIMLMTEHCKGTRSKHLAIKINYVLDLVRNGVLTIQYLRTQRITPDVLSKPLQGQTHDDHRDVLLGMKRLRFEEDEEEDV